MFNEWLNQNRLAKRIRKAHQKRKDVKLNLLKLHILKATDSCKLHWF